MTHCDYKGRQLSLDEMCFMFISYPVRAVFRNTGKFDDQGYFHVGGSFDPDHGIQLAYHIKTDELDVIEKLSNALAMNITIVPDNE